MPDIDIISVSQGDITLLSTALTAAEANADEVCAEMRPTCRTLRHCYLSICCYADRRSVHFINVRCYELVRCLRSRQCAVGLTLHCVTKTTYHHPLFAVRYHERLRTLCGGPDVSAVVDDRCSQQRCQTLEAGVSSRA